MEFFITQAIVLAIIIFLVYLLTWFLPTDSPWSPWWATSKEIARKVCKLAKVGKKDVFYELGSGTGTTCVIAAKEFKAKRVLGIESDASRIWWSKRKAKQEKVDNVVEFLKTDFFKIDLSPATVVYLYLVPRVIKKIKPKLLKDLKPGTRVASYIYKIDYLPSIAKDVDREIYVYEIPKKRKKK